jgi:nucleoside-diphosphate-sugar epimerase
MRILVTGHNGYIGTVLVPMLQSAGHDVAGLDSYLYEGCTFGPEPEEPATVIRKDVRDVTREDLEGFDAILHLAALCNDPLGDLDPQITYDINLHAAVRLAELAKEAGVGRFILSSTCSVYGAGGQDWLYEDAQWAPVTPYGHSKAQSEPAIQALADDDFSPTLLRHATAYGLSSRLRGDLVVNNLAAYAYTTGEALIKSDGSPWRPLVHIEDISRAFTAVVSAPRENVHNEVFNVGRTSENYRVREVAELVEEVIPDCKIVFAEGGGPDTRNYRVNCDKLPSVVPEFQPVWTVKTGLEQLYEAFKANGLTLEDYLSARFMRIRHVQDHMAKGELGGDLRWINQPVESA